MAPESLGLMSTCTVCGGRNARTGKERLGPLTSPAFGNGPGYRVRSHEYVCTECGRRVWGESDTQEECPKDK
jgi:hypothetical protein